MSTLHALQSRQAFSDGSKWTGGESGGKCLKFFLNDVIESLDRIESGKSCQTLGATTPKALAPVAVLVLWNSKTFKTLWSFKSDMKLHKETIWKVLLLDLYTYTRWVI